MVLPKHPAAAARTVAGLQEALATPGQLQRDLEAAIPAPRLSAGNTIAQHEANMSQISGMRMSRGQRKMQKLGTTGDVTAAIPRFYDPMEYWDLSGLPFNMQDEGHRHKLHKWMRLYYATHPIIPTLVDIFTRFPLSGLELYSQDKKLTSFYEDLFLDNHKLNYEDFLVALGREYWLVGEVFPLGSFNETLGVWEREELLNPEDIVMHPGRPRLLGSRTGRKLPAGEKIVRVAASGQPGADVAPGVAAGDGQPRRAAGDR